MLLRPLSRGILTWRPSRLNPAGQQPRLKRTLKDGTLRVKRRRSPSAKSGGGLRHHTGPRPTTIRRERPPTRSHRRKLGMQAYGPLPRIRPQPPHRSFGAVGRRDNTYCVPRTTTPSLLNTASPYGSSLLLDSCRDLTVRHTTFNELSAISQEAQTLGYQPNTLLLGAPCHWPHNFNSCRQN